MGPDLSKCGDADTGPMFFCMFLSRDCKTVRHIMPDQKLQALPQHGCRIGFNDEAEVTTLLDKTYTVVSAMPQPILTPLKL